MDSVSYMIDSVNYHYYTTGEAFIDRLGQYFKDKCYIFPFKNAAYIKSYLGIILLGFYIKKITRNYLIDESNDTALYSEEHRKELMSVLMTSVVQLSNNVLLSKVEGEEATYINTTLFSSYGKRTTTSNMNRYMLMITISYIVIYK